MPHEGGKDRRTGIRCDHLVLSVQVKTPQFFSGKPIEQLRRSFSGVDPLLFQLLQIDWVRQVFSPEVDLLVTGVAIGLIQEQSRGVPFVLPTGSPDDGSQAEIGAIDQQNVKKVADFTSAGEGQNLVGGQIGLMETVAEVVILLNRENRNAEAVVQSSRSRFSSRMTSALTIPSPRRIQ